MPKVISREVPAERLTLLQASGMSPLLARVYAARGISSPTELEYSLDQLLRPSLLKNMTEFASRLIELIQAHQKIVVIADYDADGATACAVAVRGLRMFGANIDYLVPNRFEYGYGLSPEIVDFAMHLQPDVLLTVDNGIASAEGVARAAQLGVEVLITDHHLPGDCVPEALIVNPNQVGCEFPSKHLAGVGVMFYVLLAVRSLLRERGAFADRPEPNLGALLDLVALGTVADVVALDRNNRLLVHHGLQRMRQGRACHGIRALFEASGRSMRDANTFDLGFMLGPRLNAAGRLDDMSLGIECLLAEDAEAALASAAVLDGLNRERRQIESGMQEEALSLLEDFVPQDTLTIALCREGWHQGVVGILASRLRERFHRPAFVFAPSEAGIVKGSGRSISGFHLRDALDWISKRYPDLILKFGGHAMAAGLSIREESFPLFVTAFEQVGRLWMDDSILTHIVETDGALLPDELSLQTAETFEAGIWGQAFAPPVFHGRFEVESQRVVGGKHLKLKLRLGSQCVDGIFFNRESWLPDVVDLVYQIQSNVFRGAKSLQLSVLSCID